MGGTLPQAGGRLSGQRSIWLRRVHAFCRHSASLPLRQHFGRFPNIPACAAGSPPGDALPFINGWCCVLLAALPGNQPSNWMLLLPPLTVCQGARGSPAINQSASHLAKSSKGWLGPMQCPALGFQREARTPLDGELLWGICPSGFQASALLWLLTTSKQNVQIYGSTPS